MRDGSYVMVEEPPSLQRILEVDKEELIPLPNRKPSKKKLRELSHDSGLRRLNAIFQ
jgi:hypothetical protein